VCKEKVERRSTVEAEFAAHEVGGLDAVRALIDRSDPRDAEVLGGASLLDETHAAMHLDAETGDVATDVRAPSLCQGCQHVGTQCRLLVSAMPTVSLPEGVIDKAAGAGGQRPHTQQHSADGRMFGDLLPALAALLRVGNRPLGCRFGDSDALQADVEASI